MPYLLAVALSAPLARAETGVVSASGAGRDAPEAINNLLRTTVTRYFRDTEAQLARTILQSEILPNASSFVQSYKITEGSRGGAVSLSANVDLDVIHGLLALTPKNIGEEEGAKALVVVRGAKLPDSILASLKNRDQAPDPFRAIEASGRERFLRREFGNAELAAGEMQSMGAGDDLGSPELLRGLGAKAGARVALGITGRYETYDNENSHNKEERVVLSATMVDVRAGTVIGRANVNVVNPKSRKEQYVADLQRNLLEESKDLFQDVFVAAGRKLVKTEAHTEFAVLRVVAPPSSVLVGRFKALLEAVPGVRSVVEHSVRRGKYDFAVRPPLSAEALAKAVSAIQAPDLAVAQAETGAPEADERAPTLAVHLEAKEQAVPPEGGANANPHR